MYGMRNSSFTKDQLTSLGVTKEMNINNTQFMRPLFPILQTRPLEIPKDSVLLEYKLLFKEDFRSRLFETHNTNDKSEPADNYSLKLAVS